MFLLYMLNKDHKHLHFNALLLTGRTLGELGNALTDDGIFF